MNGPVVKICGLTRSEDVVLAADLGAWALGFVFAESPRQVTAEQAGELATAASSSAALCLHGRLPVLVGVFLDAPAGAIAEAVLASGLTGVQLHAPQPGAQAVRKALGARACEVVVIQAVTVPGSGSSATGLKEAVSSLQDGADLLLFDTSSGGRSGGTGTPFPWGWARKAGEGRPYLVAGGLGPRNVALALKVSGASGVDVSSGVESSPGVKDPALLRALFAALDIGRHSAGGGRDAPPDIYQEPSEGRRP